jgi:dihydroorotase
MTSPEDCFSFGDDGACHHDDSTQLKGVKVTSSGIVIGGQTQIPEAVISYVIEKFVEAGRLDHLSAFLGGRAREGYGLSRTVYPPQPITFKREDWTVPERIETTVGGKTIRCVVAMGGQTRKYRVVREPLTT